MSTVAVLTLSTSKACCLTARYGDVVELKAETIEDDSALKGKLALFAKITPTGELIALNKASQKVYIELLIDTLTLTDAEDMPDQVRAKLHKIIGLVLRDSGKPEQALFHLKRAFQLDSRSGVKKDIERLETALRKAAASR